MVPNNVRLPLTRVDEHFYGGLWFSTNQSPGPDHVTGMLSSHWSVIIILQAARSSISLIYFSSSFSGGLFFVFEVCHFLGNMKIYLVSAKKLGAL